MTTLPLLSSDLLEKISLLIRLCTHFAGEPPASFSPNAIAKIVEKETECTCTGKSLKNFVDILHSKHTTLSGFRKNETKETLSAFVLLKAGVANLKSSDEIQIKRDTSGRGFNYPEPLYWQLFCENIEVFKKLIPAVMQIAPDGAPICHLQPIPYYFEDTDWFIYCRSKKGGIYQHILKIRSEKEAGGILNKVHFVNGSEKTEDYRGHVGADTSTGFLIFDLVTVHSKQKHLHIKVKAGRAVACKLMCGQSNFISSLKPQIMSDVVVMLKIPEQLRNTASPCFFQSGTEQYLTLPLSLRRYFADARLCRLSSPTDDLLSIAQFDDWLTEQRNQKKPSKQDTVLQHACGDFALFYDSPLGERMEQTVNIAFDPNVEEVKALMATDYRELLLPASIYRTEEVITLFQTEIVGSETKTFYLNFRIGLSKNTVAADHFEGVVAGCWMGLRGSSALAMLVRKDQPDYEALANKYLRPDRPMALN